MPTHATQDWTTEQLANVSADWADVTNKPSTFSPSSHTHAQSEVTNLVADLGAKQASLVSGTNIKTVNGASLLGSGDLAVVGNPWTFFGASASDTTTGANTTPVSVSGLSFNFVANSVYLIEVVGSIQNAAATTGVGLQLDVSAAVDSANLAFVHQLANTGTLTGGHAVADDASVGVSSGTPANNQRVPFIAQGVLDTGANAGTCQLRFRSEVAAVAVLKAGCVMRVAKV